MENLLVEFDKKYSQKLILSIIFPIYNESGNITELFKRTHQTLIKLFKYTSNYEVIFVNDGSDDESEKIIHKLKLEHDFVKIISHKKRKSHAFAVNTGFNQIGKSMYTIIMNADLQYNPADLPLFLISAENGADIVNGWRFNKNDPFLKNYSSKIYNFLIRFLFGLNIKDAASNFALYRSEIIKNLYLEYDDQRYLISKLFYMGRAKRIDVVPIRHYPRKSGFSKYPVKNKIIYGILEFFNKWSKIYIQKARLSQRILPYQPDNYEISIVIPVKNESENIIELIKRIVTVFIERNKLRTEIIVINDSSTDNTCEVIQSFIEEYKLNNIVKIIDNFKSKHTVGMAIRYGINNSSADKIITMDGDLSHSPEEAIKIFTLLKKGYDAIIGGRYLPGQAPFEPKERYNLSRKFNLISQVVNGSRIMDYTTGFRGFTRDIYDSLQIQSDGFEFHIEFNTKLALKSRKIGEIPIRYLKRTRGKSKLKYWTVFPRYLFRLLFSRFL